MAAAQREAALRQHTAPPRPGGPRAGAVRGEAQGPRTPHQVPAPPRSLCESQARASSSVQRNPCPTEGFTRQVREQV